MAQPSRIPKRCFACGFRKVDVEHVYHQDEVFITCRKCNHKRVLTGLDMLQGNAGTAWEDIVSGALEKVKRGDKFRVRRERFDPHKRHRV